MHGNLAYCFTDEERANIISAIMLERLTYKSVAEAWNVSASVIRRIIRQACS